ncbi:MAG: NUDIX hydrolase, partial [Oscillospiraceae bacterium]|nr:NUDIX hydrolase [Oscillospiraceae bacterium]
MDRVLGVKRQTNNRFLNLYELDAVFRDGSRAPYYVSSRRKDVDSIKAVTHDNHADGVILYGVYGEEKDKVVLIRQFRYPINGYVYEFPAGLVEPNEDMLEAGIREMQEETGLEFRPVEAGAYSRPFFTTIGMTDESCGTVYGYCSGTPSVAGQEGTEDIQVVLADREECKRILREENVAIMCAYMLMHFIASEGDPLA